MSGKKKIPCRVCGKLFEPCSYCQSHADIFRWRNFACSRECAVKYINDTITYRESLKHDKEKTSESIETEKIDTKFSIKKNTIKRNHNKKDSTEFIETEIKIENKETE